MPEQKPPLIVEFNGEEYEFPADATDAQISRFLKAIPASNAKEVPKAQTWAVKFPTKVTIGMGPQLVPPVGEEGAEPSRMTRTVEALSGVGEDSPEALARLVGTTPVLPGTASAITSAVGAVADKVVPFATRQALKTLGVPLWMLEGAGALASNARRAMSEAAETAKAADIPFSVPKGELTETALDLTRRLRAEHQAATGATKLPSPNPIAPAVEAPLKLKLNVEEAAAALKMRASKKYTDQQIENVIRAARELKMRFGLSSDATVADIVKKANETGRMTR